MSEELSHAGQLRLRERQWLRQEQKFRYSEESLRMSLEQFKLQISSCTLEVAERVREYDIIASNRAHARARAAAAA